MGRTPHKGMTAAGAQPPGPRLPNGLRSPESWSAKARIVTDGCRALLLHGRVGRMGQGGGECGSGAGHIPRRPSGRHLSRGSGSEQEKRDHQEKTGIGAHSRRARQALEKKGSNPVPEAACGGRISHRSDCLRISLSLGGVRRLSSPVAQSAFCTASVRACPPGRLPSAGTLRVLRMNPIPGRQAFLGSLNHASMDDITSESIVASFPWPGLSTDIVRSIGSFQVWIACGARVWNHFRVSWGDMLCKTGLIAVIIPPVVRAATDRNVALTFENISSIGDRSGLTTAKR